MVACSRQIYYEYSGDCEFTQANIPLSSWCWFCTCEMVACSRQFLRVLRRHEFITNNPIKLVLVLYNFKFMSEFIASCYVSNFRIRTQETAITNVPLDGGVKFIVVVKLVLVFLRCCLMIDTGDLSLEPTTPHQVGLGCLHRAFVVNKKICHQPSVYPDVGALLYSKRVTTF